MGARRIRREQRDVDQAKSRIDNGHKKKAERARRQLRMVELIKAHQLPYTPNIMAWICTELDKPATRVTKDDVAKLVKQYSS